MSSSTDRPLLVRVVAPEERASSGEIGLPAALTPLVGRDRELAAIGALLLGTGLDGPRLLTLSGPGGVGKTRLALAVAQELVPKFAVGVTFVPLAPMSEPDRVLDSIARALGIRVSSDRPLADHLTARLRDGRRLLVLDNFEHVLAAAPLVTDLLVACPDLRVLVTSRTRLRLSGEHSFPVSPLAVPDPSQPATVDELARVDAVRLFVARARAATPDFALTQSNVQAVAEICRRLDGLPLAIELAAARTRILSPPALLARLTNRLQLLTSGPRDAPARHRTMREAIAWSHDLLTPGEQALFRRLAVFAGGFTLETVEHVDGGNPAGATVLDALTTLLDASMLHRASWAEGDVRFGMLETVREYGLEILASSGEEEGTRNAHAAWCLALVESAAPELPGPAPEPWLDRLATEHDNLRTALGWAVARATGRGALDGDGAAATPAEIGLRLAGDLWRFWRFHGHWTEGRRWLEQTLAVDDRSAPLARAKALNGAGVFADDQGDYDRAEAHYGEALALFRALGDRSQAAGALNNLADVARVRGDYDLAQARYEEALALYRQAGATQWVGMVLNNLGVLAWDRGQVDRAAVYHDEALTIFRAIGHRPQTAHTLNNLGVVAQARADYPRAAALAAECLEVYRTLGDTRGVALAHFNLGQIALSEGDAARAAVDIRHSVVIDRDLGDRLWLSRALDAMAETAGVAGEARRAALLHGAAEALREAAGVPLSAHEERERDRALHPVRAALDARTFAAIWSAGRALPVDEAVAEAMDVADVLAAPAAASIISGTAVQPPPDAGLTTRERDVLSLLVEGRSDKEIAATLFVSRRTASKHVAAILAKLGVSSRGAATAAIRDGLV